VVERRRPGGLRGAAYKVDGPHRLVSTAGIHPWNLSDEMTKPVDR